MRILIVSSFLLFKDTRFGGAKRLNSFADYLGQSHEVDRIYFDGCNEREGFEKHQSHIHEHRFLYIPFQPRATFWNWLFHVRFDLKSTLNANKKTITDFVANRQYECVFLCYPYSLSIVYLRDDISAKKWVYLEDDLLIEVATKNAQQFSGLVQLWKKIRIWQLKRFWMQQIRHVQLFLAISEEERSVVSRYFPRMSTAILKYGIDLDEFPFLGRQGNEQIVLGYIGNFNHKPNVDAVEFFLSQLFNPLKKLFSGISIIIAGSNVPLELINKWKSVSMVQVMENVVNLADFYSAIDIFCNPIISGRGLRTKVIESAAFGRPVITTSLGAEGLADLRLEIAEDEKGFKNGIARLTDAVYYSDVVHYNRTIIESNYSIKAVGSILESQLLQ